MIIEDRWAQVFASVFAEANSPQNNQYPAGANVRSDFRSFPNY